MAGLTVIGAALACPAAALAQGYATRFEPPALSGTGAGVSLSGQDGWYNPGLGSVDALVHTYTGNPHSIVPPLTGETQFVAGRAVVGQASRAQRDAGFAPGTWSATWEMTAKYLGTLPSAPNLGSFSLQPYGTSASWQTLHNWFNVANASTWRCAFMPYDAAGIEAQFPGVVPSGAWDNLQPGAWYRVRVVWSFTSNRILSVSITDMATGVTKTDTPADWYLAGGAVGGLPLATAYRLFTGGAAGNVMGWDNLTVAPACYPDCNADGSLNLSDFGCFQTKFALGDSYADCNGDGVRNLSDFGCFQTKFALGCP